MDRDAHQRLEHLLDREIEAARSLASALEAERTALTGESVEAVKTVAARKIELFGLIEALGRQRTDTCAAAHVTLPQIQSGRVPVIAGVSAAIADRWLALLDLMSGCRIANEINGYIINARRGHVTQLLQIMRGGTPVTYGPQGRTRSSPLRELARA